MSHARRDLAITGMACRFPGALNLSQYWLLLSQGMCSVGPPPAGRWPGFSSDIPQNAGYLELIDRFDPAFFGISQQEAQGMDPQQRLILMLAWECLEDAGLNPEDLKGRTVGVFIGLSSADYAQAQIKSSKQINSYTITGLAASTTANRISYFFDFKGPSLIVDTACSSALTALHLARQSLLRGEIELALVGAASILLSPLIHEAFDAAHALSPDGLCRPFDARANGICRGEGAGMVMLEPFRQAQQRKARSYALVLGTALSQDGMTQSLAAPSPAGQRSVVQAACLDAGIEAAQLTYVEAHGTGTPLGDPIEAKALGDVFKGRNKPCYLGSVKSNLGHLEAASGMAGLIKTALSLYHHCLPPSLHFEQVNPRIPLEKYALEMVLRPIDLGSEPCYAGVSAFGFGGTNAHVILESVSAECLIETSVETAEKRTKPLSESLLMPLSARSKHALLAQRETLLAWLSEQSGFSEHDADSTRDKLLSPEILLRLSQQLWHRRALLPWRGLLWEEDLGTEIGDLGPFSEAPVTGQPKIAFVFAGMGSQSSELVVQLHHEPRAREALQNCQQAFSTHLGIDWLERALQQHEKPPKAENTRSEPEDPALSQALIFSLQVALVAQWQALGVQPDAVLGSSMGEITAVYCAGMISLEAAAGLLIERIRLLKTRIGTGSMAVVGLPESRLQEALQDQPLWVASINGPELCAVAGDNQALKIQMAQWQAQDILVKWIPGVTAPSHTPMMEGLKEGLLALAQSLEPQTGVVPFWSTVTMSLCSAQDLGAEYWWQNVRQAVKIWPTIQKLSQTGRWVFVEISPHAVLSPVLDRQDKSLNFIASSRRPMSLRASLKQGLARLFGLGYPLRPLGAKAQKSGTPLDLPPYSWDLQAYWSVPDPASEIQVSSVPLKVTQALPTEGILGQLSVTLEADQVDLLGRYLQAELARALNRDPDELSVEIPLRHLGIGSLMGMELYNRIRQDLGIKLALSEVLKGPSLRELSQLILEVLSQKSPEAVSSESYPSEIKAAPLQGVAKEAYSAELSPAQQRFYFFDQLYPDSLAYHIPVVLRLFGPLEPLALKRAFEAVAQKHAILRTVYRMEASGEILQWVLPQVELDWQTANCSERELSQQIALASHARFELALKPPFRVRLWQMIPEQGEQGKQTEALLLIDMHHILADGYSFALMFQDLRAFYTQPIEMALPESEALPFTDFVRWSAAQDYTDSRNWWLKQIQDLPQQLELPGPHLRPARLDFEGALHSFALSSEEMAPLDLLSKDMGISLFTLMLSAFELVISRLSGQDQFIIGTPVLGRPELRWQSVVGPCLNLLALPVRMDSEDSVAAYLQQRQNQILEAFDHQDLPFEDLIHALNPPRDPAWQALVQIVFALHAPIETGNLGNLRVQSQPLDLGVSRFDLAFTLHPEPEGLFGTVEYRTHLYEKDFITGLILAWKQVLKLWPKQRDAALKTLVLNPKGWQPALKGDTDTAVTLAPLFNEGKPNLLACFESLVARFPQAPALIETHGETYAETHNEKDLQRVWNYDTLNQKANILARRLNAALSAQPKSSKGLFVALILPPGPEHVLSWLACWKVGCTPVPLDPEQPIGRLIRCLEQIPFQAVILPPELEAEVLCALKTEPHLEPVLLNPDVSEVPQATIVPNLDYPNQYGGRFHPPAYAIFTSGSTGLPKAVPITFESLENLVNWHQKHYALSPDDRCSQFANPAFDAAVWETLPTLLSGASLVFPDLQARRDPQELIQWLQYQAISVCFLPTPLMERVLDRLDTSPAPQLAVRHWLCGGARLQRSIPRGLSGSFWNHYGPTENTVVTTVAFIEPGSDDLPIGQPLPGMYLYLLDRAGLPLPDGLPGQLAIAGVGLSAGYLNQPGEAPFSPFVDSPAGPIYLSGDRCRLEHQTLYFLDRLDRQVKHRGIRLEPGEIESLLHQRPEVKAVHVALRSGLLQAWIYPKCSPEALTEIQSWLRTHLPEALLPERLESLDDWPETGRGKLDPAALPDLASAMPVAVVPTLNDAFEPDDAFRMRSLWSEVLKIPLTSLPDNPDFFQLGGHSLLAMDLGHRIQETFQVDFPLEILFEHPKLLDQLVWLAAQPLSRFQWPEFKTNPAALYEPFSLTSVQEAYWIGRQSEMALGAVSAHAYLELEVPYINAERLERVVRDLIERHPILRMCINPDGQQYFLAQVPPWKLKLHDLRGLSSDAQAQKIALLRSQLEYEVRPADQWPLFDLQISRLPDQDLLHLSLDALMADARSLFVLGHELQERYLTESETPLVPLSVSFRDWVQYTEELKTSARYARDKAFWLKEIQTLPRAPHLPVQSQNLHMLPRKYLRLNGSLPGSQWQVLKTQAAEMGVSISAYLLSVFAAVLGRWQEEPGLTLNLTSFQRPPAHPEIAQVIGDFTQLSLLPVALQSDFRQQTQDLQKKLLQVLEHQLFNGLELMREIRRQHGPEASQMPVVFTSMLDQGNFEFPLNAKLHYARTQTPQVWLDHQLAEQDGTLVYFWDFPEHLFPQGLPEALFETWEASLIALAEAESLPQEPFPVLTGHEAGPPENQLQSEACLLHQAALQQALKTPDALALIAPDRQLSYAEWSSEAQALAAEILPLIQQRREELSRLNSDEPVCVAILLKMGWRQAVAVLAVLLAGGTYVPLYPDWPVERLEAILTQTRAVAILSDTGLAEDLEGLPRFVISQHSTPSTLSPSTSVAAQPVVTQPVRAEDLAYIIFTSGSTGQPKGVMLSHQAVWNTVSDLNQRLQLGAQDRLFALSALNFDLSVYDIFGPLSVGGALVYPDPLQIREPLHWLELCQAQSVTVWNSVPALMQMLVTALETPPGLDPIPSLRTIMLSGDWIPLSLPSAIQACFGPGLELYSLGGATEAAIWSIYYPIQVVDPLWTSIPYGYALKNQAVFVLDTELRLSSLWATGEIFIAGSGLASGYFHAPDLSAQAFIQHPDNGLKLYRTGDFGRYRNDGSIEFLGRRDQQVKIRGYRVELAEIEAALQACEGVEQAVVLAPGPREARYLSAWWTTASAVQAESPEERLQQELSQRLPAYMIPVKWVQLEHLPLNQTGKVDRKALLLSLDLAGSPLQTPLQTLAANVPPLSPKASEREIDWLHVLRPLLIKSLNLDLSESDFDPDLDLLSLGISSIDIVRLGNALQSQFGHSPGMGQLFQLRTLSALSRYFAGRSDLAPEPQVLSNSETLILPGGALYAFKATLPNLLKADQFLAAGRVLPACRAVFSSEKPYQNWHSERVFSGAGISLKQLSCLLAFLRAEGPITPMGPLKYLYASAGGLYPVQVFLDLRIDAIEGLEAGQWYYHPLDHALYPINHNAHWDLSVHFPHNQPMASSATLALYLVLDYRAIRPVYGPDSRDYALLEAGSMAQLLRQQAPAAEMGYCQIGGLNTPELSERFRWSPEQELLSSFLLGGGLAPRSQAAIPLEEALGLQSLNKTESKIEPDLDIEKDDWEEWII